MIKSVDQLLLMSDDKTKFIPGQGPVCSNKELEEYRNLLKIARDNGEQWLREIMN